MKRFKNILFIPDPKDNHHSAFDRAMELARDNGATLTVFDAVAEYAVGVLEAPPIHINDLMEMVAEERRKANETLAERARVADIPCHTKVVVGNPAVEIVRQVLRGNHDLVMKAAEGDVGKLGQIFGSLDLFLMRKCPCPVWMVSPKQDGPLIRILAAIDPPADARHSNHLTDTILSLAFSLAEIEAAELHVGHAWSLYGERALKGPWLHLPRDQVKDHSAKLEDFHSKSVFEKVNAYSKGEVVPSIHIRNGDARDVLPELIEELGIDLVIMGTLCRTGIPGFFIGNTAETILHKVDCSVLCLKPAGFDTPVKL